MIPEKLILKGIYSYRKLTEINFKPLIQHGLFGIFGAVGSGKSTLLEAISYALYGESDRLSRAKQTYNMLNLAENELHVEFFFEHDKKHYHFKVQAQRSKKHHEKVSSPNRSAYELIDGKWTPLESTNASKITGLKYEHFKQIVIIPQGKFNEFIHQRASDRIEMLRELFPLEQFNLKTQIGSLLKENHDQIVSLEGELKQFESFTGEELKSKRDSIKREREKHQKLKLELEKLDEQIKRSEQLKQWVTEMGSTQKQLDELTIEQAQILKLANQIEQFEHYTQRYRDLFASSALLKKDLAQFSNSLTERNKQLELLEVSINENEKIVQYIHDSDGTLPELEGQLASIERCKELKNFVAEAEKKKLEFQQIEERFKTETQIRKSKEEQVEKVEVKLKSLRLVTSREAQFAQYQSLSLQSAENVQQIEQQTQQLQQDQNSIAQLGERKQEILTDLEQYQDDIAHLRELPANQLTVAISEKCDQAKAALAELEKRQAKLNSQSVLHQFAYDLEDGQTCDLCGSTHHPQPYSDESASKEKAILDQEIRAKRQAISALELAQKDVANLIGQFHDLNKRIQQSTSKLHDLEEKAKNLKKQQSEIGLNLNSAEITVELAKMNKAKLEIQTFEHDLAELKLHLSDRKPIEGLQREMQSLNEATLNLQFRIDSITEQTEDKFQELTAAELENRAQQLVGSIKKLKTAEENIVPLREKISTLQAEAELLRTQIDQVQLELSALEENIRNRLQQDKIEHADEVRNVLKSDLQVSEAHQKIQAFKLNLQQTEDRLKALKLNVGDQSFDETAHEKLQNRQKESEELFHQQIGILAEFKKEIERIETKLKEKKALLAKHDKQQKRAISLETMSKLFKHDKFLKFIGTIYLRQLCHIANDRFKVLTQNKLQLEVDDQFQFLVRDFLHNGRTRLLKTLSGGQTFQAALCLALALSEQIQAMQGVKQQFFFMDEGFGSLDKQSLEIVFDSLKQLRTENRVVGIISHVEELQSEIDHFLLIENKEDQGSIVRTSY